MKFDLKKLAILGGIALAAGILPLSFYARSPVLVLAEKSFTVLYGEKRARREAFRSSLALFRPVKPVITADDAGDDIIQVSVKAASKKPFCVLFPLSFSTAAKMYRENNPDVPVVILEGRYFEDATPSKFAIGNNTDDYFLYKTDVSLDFYRAGIAAGLIIGEKEGRVAVFLDSHLQNQGREAFLRALSDMEKQVQTSFYTSYAQFSSITNVLCVVLAGVGVEYLEKYSNIPVIFFSWMDPELIPLDVAMVINDSPWVQAEQAARMVRGRAAKGKIQSKMVFLHGNGIEKKIKKNLRKIR